MTAAPARAARLALLAFVSALAFSAAGCLQSGGSPGPSSSSTSSTGADGSATGPSTTAPPQPPQGSPTVLALLPEFALGPCVGVSVLSAQPRDAVQALLPEGFTVAPFGTQDTALAAVDVYRCGNLTTPTASVADTVYGQVYTHVLRPEGVPGAPDGVVQEYVFRVLAGQDVLSALWPAAGYETRNGTADVSVDALPGLPLDPGARTGASSVGDEYGSLAQGQANAPVAPAWAGSFARYTQLADGSVLLWTGAYDVPATHSGEGFFSVAGDDPFAPFEAANNVPGSARMAESVSMVGLRLERIFA